MADKVRDPFDLIGTTIDGKYRVASVIGDGGFGVVYRGVHTGFGELIAVKCLKIPANLDEKHRQELLDQLKEEGRLLHKLSRATSGIVQALDVGAMTTAAGVWVPFLVLEWLEGETLAELQRNREIAGLPGMDVQEAVELLTPAARALAVAHEHKIAHRDVKPANLFVTKVGDKRTVKVLDFGIAKVLTDTTMTEALALTRQGPSAFTPRYGAPEQFNKQRGASGPWTDVFALGLILVELCTGKRALDGDDPTQLYVASADPTLRPTFRGRGLDVPDVVESVIAKALHVEPKYRYADAADFWDALTQALGLNAEGRTSGPSISSDPGRASGSQGARWSGPSAPSKKADSGKSSGPSANLETAEFAAQELLAMGPDGPHSGPPEPHAPTRPVESLQKGDPKIVVVSKKGATPAPMSVTSASEQVVAAAKEPGSNVPPQVKEGVANPSPNRAVPDDPMAETPLFARVPSAVAEAKKRGVSGSVSNAQAKDPGAVPPTQLSEREQSTTKAPTSREPPSSVPVSSQREERSGRGVLWAFLAISAAAGVTAYLYFSRPGATVAPGPHGSSSAVNSARPVATLPLPPSSSASTSGSASSSVTASVSATADAGPPPPAPPEDMVYIGPLVAKLGEGPTLRDVTFSRGFYIEKREVSAHAYHACVEAGVCSSASEPQMPERFADRPDAGDADAGPSEQTKKAEDAWRPRCTEPKALADYPVNCLTYPQAEQYCRWRKRRLPTEAEWEVTAQGIDQRAYPWGNSRASCETACVDKNVECRGGDVSSCAIGSRRGDKTPQEVMDLAGNVAEWVVDGFGAKPVGGTDPKANPWAKTRVVRGGSFFDNLDMLRASARREVPPAAAVPWIGVRCAMDLPPSP